MSSKKLSKPLRFNTTKKNVTLTFHFVAHWQLMVWYTQVAQAGEWLLGFPVYPVLASSSAKDSPLEIVFEKNNLCYYYMQRMLILKLVSESFNAQDNIKNIILLKYYTIIISLIIQNPACVLTFSRPCSHWYCPNPLQWFLTLIQ